MFLPEAMSFFGKHLSTRCVTPPFESIQRPPLPPKVIHRMAIVSGRLPKIDGKTLLLKTPRTVTGYRETKLEPS